MAYLLPLVWCGYIACSSAQGWVGGAAQPSGQLAAPAAVLRRVGDSLEGSAWRNTDRTTLMRPLQQHGDCCRPEACGVVDVPGSGLALCFSF